ncbi:MAG: hypothetical protein H8D69_00570 [Chloroflexi bacterium]|nr:hypothetical protein [Chloroflexota bacterium]
MPKISRTTLLISIAIMIAVVAAACDSAATKPTQEPPTPIPTVSTDVADTGSLTGLREALSDPVVLECLSEQLGESLNIESGEIGSDLLGRLGNEELAMLESCGVDVDSGLRGAGTIGASSGDPEVQQCIAGELGIEFDSELGTYDRSALRAIDPEKVTEAFASCGAEQARRPANGGFVGGSIADPEVQACLTRELGEEFFGRLGQGSGIGLTPESIAALEECGVGLPDTGGGFRFGGGPNGFGGDDGVFGGGLRGGRGTLGGDGSFQECLTNALGDDALTLLRNPIGAPSPEVQEALEQCGGAIGIPVEPDGGIGDGAAPILVEPEVAPTATAVPVSDLTIEQLTCLAGELDPAGLASAIVATSSGDLSQISDEILAALQTCGVGV